MTSDSTELKSRYDKFAESLDYKTTACDYQLRELEINLGASYMSDGQHVLDVGCGLGYASVQYASRNKVAAHGIDYSEKMVEGAKRLLDETKPALLGTVAFQHASVLELPYDTGSFDVVTSSRCLMALLDWELQKKALVEIHRVLKPGGLYVMMEGTFDGLDRLNDMRTRFGLEPIAADGKDRLFTLKFRESELLEYIKPLFSLEHTQRFGMYYFLTRVVQPLLVAPDKPSYDHKLNEVAREIAKVVPDFEGLGHLVGFVLSKRR
ncbi:MAG: methyltransferase domain-containing protein [Rhodocyclaceae bacterium]|nr:methyltransferase domain-containing protein [Rhodocyclaceae bacterium]